MQKNQFFKGLYIGLMVMMVGYISAAFVFAAPQSSLATECISCCTDDDLPPGYICIDGCGIQEPICGNGIVEYEGEEYGEVCDERAENNANINGIPCTPEYGSSCSYCAADCRSWIAVQGPYCGDEMVSDGEECDPTVPDSIPEHYSCSEICTLHEYEHATVSGHKFEDRNENGMWDEGEPALNGWEICQETVRGKPDVGDSGKATAIVTQIDISDEISVDPITPESVIECVITGNGSWEDGYYEFKHYAPGEATLTETLQEGWKQTAPVEGTHTVEITSPSSYPDNNFGNYFPRLPVLTIEKNVNKTTVNPSGILTYTIVIMNAGDADAVNVEITDVLPAGLTFANDDGSSSGDTEKAWTWDMLAAGASETVEYDVIVDSSASADMYDNIATVTASNVEEEVSDDATTEVKIPVVLGEEDTVALLEIEKTVAEEFINPGGTANYTVVVTNIGDAVAYNTTLSDVLPAGMTYTDDSLSTKTWELGDLVPDESVTVTYEAYADASAIPGKYMNTASATADNASQVSDHTDLEIRAVAVLGAEDIPTVLPTTGIGLLGVVLAGAGLGAVTLIRQRR